MFFNSRTPFFLSQEHSTRKRPRRPQRKRYHEDGLPANLSNSANGVPVFGRSDEPVGQRTNDDLRYTTTKFHELLGTASGAQDDVGTKLGPIRPGAERRRGQTNHSDLAFLSVRLRRAANDTTDATSVPPTRQLPGMALSYEYGEVV